MSAMGAEEEEEDLDQQAVETLAQNLVEYCPGWSHPKRKKIAANCVIRGYYKIAELGRANIERLESLGFREGDIERLKLGIF